MSVYHLAKVDWNHRNWKTYWMSTTIVSPTPTAMRRLLIGTACAAALSTTFSACAVSTQQEVELGSNYSAQINRQLPLVTDPEVVRYVSQLGDSIAGLADSRNLEWHFYVVDSKEVNAFAVPGGFIYVNRGLIERTTKMDQLASALGHEIGHVVRRHSVKQMQKAQGANMGVTLACILTRVCEYGATQAAVEIGGGALFASFSRQDEAEADQVGIQYLVRAGIDPRGMPEMFRILIKERDNQPSSGINAWFATHPLEEDRVAATERTIAQISPATLSRLTKDSRRYQSMKARLASLPMKQTRAAR